MTRGNQRARETNIACHELEVLLERVRMAIMWIGGKKGNYPCMYFYCHEKES
jgi:hypothetical protein